MDPARLVLAVIVAGTLIRLVCAALTGLSVDESYTVAVSRPLGWSYLDHPPISFWIPALVADLTGRENGFLLRIPFILLFAGTTWMMFRLGALAFGPRAGAYAALLLNVSPVFSFTSGGWVLPDGPLMFFMVTAAWCVLRALEPAKPHATRWWLAAGAASGLAALSKYHGVFLPLAALIYLASSPERRRWFRRPGPYFALAVMLLLTSPVLAWNARHHWVSLRFQGGRGEPAAGLFHPVALLASLGGQAGYVLPWIWIPLLVLLVRALRAGPRSGTRWFLACLAAAPILFFTLPALGGRPGLPHWEAPGYLMLFPLLDDAVARRIARGDAATRRWVAGSVAAYAVILVVAVSQGVTGWMSRAFPGAFAHGDPTWEVVDWGELRPALVARNLVDSPGRFVAAMRWMDAGKIGRALGPSVPVVCLSGNPHQFEFLHPERDFLGRDAILVAPPNSSPDAVRGIAPCFRSLEPLGSVAIHRAGRPAFELPLYLGHGFTRPVPLDFAD